MATEREKKDEARRILRDELPSLPLPIRRLTPIGRAYELAKLLAEGLIELDPFDIISSDPEMIELFNDDNVIIRNGFLERRDMPSGRDVIRSSGQFRRDLILPRTTTQTKRTRKKTKTDKNMSKALTMANKRFRTKSGKLRKGATQAKVMKFAHKLLKKMK